MRGNGRHRHTALRLAKFFANSVEFGLNRQTSYDIEAARRKIRKGLEKIGPLKAA
jgi:plasmid maintenance system antidote protein VapI